MPKCPDGCTCRRHLGWHRSHGMTRTPTFRTWTMMIQRCTNPKQDNFRHYGGRGIRVCDRWLSFESFLEDMGIRPDGKTLDRRDANGDYTPENCRWATKSEQMLNKRPATKSGRLNDWEAIQIRWLATDGGLTAAVIGKAFGISRQAVSMIRTGATWGHLRA